MCITKNYMCTIIRFIKNNNKFFNIFRDFQYLPDKLAILAEGKRRRPAVRVGGVGTDRLDPRTLGYTAYVSRARSSTYE